VIQPNRDRPAWPVSFACSVEPHAGGVDVANRRKTQPGSWRNIFDARCRAENALRWHLMIHVAIGCLVISLTCVALFGVYPLVTGADVAHTQLALSIVGTAMSIALIWNVR
jgi:hypothetical protein